MGATVFLAEEDPEGEYYERVLGESICTEGNAEDELKFKIKSPQSPSNPSEESVKPSIDAR